MLDVLTRLGVRSLHTIDALCAIKIFVKYGYRNFFELFCLHILQNVPIVLTIFLEGPHIKDSPRTTGALVVNFRETKTTNFRSLCSFLWTESTSSQPLH